MNSFTQDLRYGLRSLLKTPGFTLVAVLTLALGVGANAAIFSVLEAVVLRDLPYQDPDRLAVLWTRNIQQNLPDGSSFLNFRDWKAQSRELENMAAYVRPEFTRGTPYNDQARRSAFFTDAMQRLRALPGVAAVGAVSDFFIHRQPDYRIALEGQSPGRPEDPAPPLTEDQVIPGYFEAMRIPLVRGRLLQDSDLAQGAPSVVVINEEMGPGLGTPDSGPRTRHPGLGTPDSGPRLGTLDWRLAISDSVSAQRADHVNARGSGCRHQGSA
jgi:hypothetical protein